MLFIVLLCTVNRLLHIIGVLRGGGASAPPPPKIG